MEELKSKLLDVQHILENNLTKKVILESLKDYVNYDDVQESIESYLNNFKLINEADNEVLKGLNKHLNHFIKNTKDATKISLYHMELLNDMNFFIKNSFKRTSQNDMNFFIKNSFKRTSQEDRVRILDIANEIGTSNAVVIEKAKELGYDVKVANSNLTVEQAGILVDYVINGIKPKAIVNSNPNILKDVPKNNNTPEAVWIIAPGEDASIWEECKNGGYIAIGWDIINVNDYTNKNDLKKALILEYDVKKNTRKDTFLWNFCKNINIGDIVVARKGRSTIVGIGEIISDYIAPNSEENPRVNNEYQQIRRVKWFDTEEYVVANKLLPMDTVSKINSQSEHIVNILNYSLNKYYKSNEIELKQETTYLIEKPNNEKKEEIIKQKFSDEEIKYKFTYKNILLKGVPGTGKSRTLNHIINNHLNLKEEYQETNVLRINIHSASSNADLMQGIGISSNENGNIEYKEKQGLILELIEKATFSPNQPFVLVLEEIQENNLNELIGDLIYLIEDSKRAKGYKADNKPYTYSELIDIIIKQNSAIHSVKLPSLISKVDKVKRMIIPHNLFIFCTSNYRDDRKVIEDNLLRRFEVIEIYPKYKDTIGNAFKSDEVSNFLKDLNTSIVSVCSDNGEIHPDRFMIGHSIWLDVETKEDFNRAFLKVITEFKDVKDMHFDDFKKIIKEIKIFGMTLSIENSASYEVLINILQNDCYDFLK